MILSKDTFQKIIKNQDAILIGEQFGKHYSSQIQETIDPKKIIQIHQVQKNSTVLVLATDIDIILGAKQLETVFTNGCTVHVGYHHKITNKVLRTMKNFKRVSYSCQNMRWTLVPEEVLNVSNLFGENRTYQSV